MSVCIVTCFCFRLSESVASRTTKPRKQPSTFFVIEDSFHGASRRGGNCFHLSGWRQEGRLARISSKYPCQLAIQRLAWAAPKLFEMETLTFLRSFGGGAPCCGVDGVAWARREASATTSTSLKRGAKKQKQQVKKPFCCCRPHLLPSVCCIHYSILLELLNNNNNNNSTMTLLGSGFQMGQASTPAMLDLSLG